MAFVLRYRFMLGERALLCLPLVALIGAAPAQPTLDPLRFFEGRTVSQSTVKIMLKKPYSARSIGQGRIESDGSLTLVQQVLDEGQPAKQRRWRVRRADADSFTAVMTEAVGPVAIDRVGPAYRFRFKMKDGLNVEQWMKPLPGLKAAEMSAKIKKMGVTVAKSEGTIRKIG
ncbi:DUF3833 domain-containing protein [Sphingomonas piscis]|uniref:DUF3833 domain-containing protein n=1 Tax=Sphingomonas piscis TaxID=2714943 RepID=A0A6G7YPD6_9SPHN|nr:DUF3833 domain-containing protein [Sphingomonas piscis]QIK78603.1 DUF3833 domain-containing protein [Sphingomonas piscis]